MCVLFNEATKIAQKSSAVLTWSGSRHAQCKHGSCNAWHQNCTTFLWSLLTHFKAQLGLTARHQNIKQAKTRQKAIAASPPHGTAQLESTLLAFFGFTSGTWYLFCVTSVEVPSEQILSTKSLSLATATYREPRRPPWRPATLKGHYLWWKMKSRKVPGRVESSQWWKCGLYAPDDSPTLLLQGPGIRHVVKKQNRCVWFGVYHIHECQGSGVKRWGVTSWHVCTFRCHSLQLKYSMLHWYTALQNTPQSAATQCNKMLNKLRVSVNQPP